MLPEDIQLQQPDLMDLSGRAEAREFFGRLGYDTSLARETFPRAEGMPQRLQEAVRYLELVATDDLGLLNVYLIELASVTVAHIQALATHFKSRPGQVLAVLTQDYRRLDFVLFELREVSAQATSSVGFRVLPRRFTFDREGPTPERLRVILRFLRRLSWTEPDGLAQWDKLKSAFSIAEWSEEFFDNRGLFADYFLKNRLPLQDAWNDPALRQARDEMRSEIAAARARFREADETALREGLLESIVAKLGFDLRECKTAADDSTRLPDYELLDPQTGEKLAVCLAYQWGRLLDGPDPKDQLTPDENPGAAVLDLLEQGNDWAIVTNGKHWRLYSARTESRATNFYQVDAEEAAADVPDAFRYFWLMFRADAFRPCEIAVAGEARIACFLEELLDGSRRYAKEVGDRLKRRVFQDIFPVLSEGFIQDIRHKDGADADLGEEQLDLVYNATLTLLYRLLFLLYAESRDLLPVAEVGGYYEKSLTALKDEVASAAGTAEGQRDEHLAGAYSAKPEETNLWGRLTDLFFIIGDGRTELNVPRYNGGLFLIKPEEGVEDYERPLAEFLNSHALSDQHLACAIDRLARDPDDKTHGLVMIDFKSLGVRQLGSIYEGLLEFKVRIAQEKMAVCTEKGREVILPYAEAAKKKGVVIKRVGRGRDAEEEVYQPGHVYLENSKHERRASGSYYTPDYIVKYIVEHTVGPVLDEKLEALRGDLNRACADYRKFRDQKQAAGVTPVSVRPEEWPFIQQCFDLSVLDPAMGSGHFLVTAVDFVADRLIHFLNGFPHNPIERMLKDTRRAIVDQAVRDGLVLDESKLTHINLLKRHVLKRCIYGVDLNPMAVELAKVSLWLHCFTLGAPLSFLDHHLKWGNSLVGEAGAAGQEQSAQGGFDDFSRWHDFSVAVQAYLRISGSEDATIAQVTASRDGFKSAEAILRPHRQELNVETAGHFVEPKSATKRGTWVGRAEQRNTVEGEQGWRQAQDLANEHRFFHWPLEFPEVWYEPRPGAEEQAVLPKREGEAGFDAVVGNPPWGGCPFLSAVRSISKYQYVHDDHCELFVIRALDLLHTGAAEGYVLPDTVLSPAKHKLRRWCIGTHRMRELANLGPDWFTAEVRMSAIIWLCARASEADPNYSVRQMLLTPSLRKEALDGTRSIGAIMAAESVLTPARGYLSTESVTVSLFANEDDTSIVDRIRSASVALAVVCDRGRGVELNKRGEVVGCPHCGRWDAPPRQAQDGTYDEKTCAHCGNAYSVSPDVTLRRIVRHQLLSDAGWAPYIDGDGVQRYTVRPSASIDLSAEGISYKPPALYRGPKVLIRQAGVGIHAAYDDSGAYCPQSVYVYRVKPAYADVGYSEELVLAVLCSRVFLYLVFKEFGEIDSTRAFAKMTHARLASMPLPALDTDGAVKAAGSVRTSVRRIVREGKVDEETDWEIEREIAALWKLDRRDIAHIVNEFAKVHVNETLLALFPSGVRGHEQSIIERWT